MQIIKMWWMVWWRLWFIFTLYTGTPKFKVSFFIALIVSCIIYFGFNKTIRTFPLFNLLRKKNPFYSIRKKVSKDKSDKTFDDFQQPVLDRPVQKEATQAGRMTGYEPYHLRKIDLPLSLMMRGVPGQGLLSSHFAQNNIRKGVEGEINFAKALGVTTCDNVIDYSYNHRGMIEDFYSFWSVSVPSENDIAIPDKYNTDVDAILLRGKTMFLIDLKFYKSGDVTYITKNNLLYCVDNVTGNYVGDSLHMSKNMQMATERFKKFYPRMDIKPLIVFMPTGLGEPIVDNVQWKGNIQGVNLTEALRLLNNVNDTRYTDDDVLNDLQKLLKKE